MSSDGIDLSKYRMPAAVDFEKSFGLPDDEAERKEMIEKLKASIDLVKAREAHDAPRLHCLPVDTHRGVLSRKPGAQKDSQAKRQWWLLPWEAVGLGVDVLMYGAYDAPRPDGTTGYGANNWQGIPTVDYLDAAVRHINSWRAGEWQDPVSKKAHLAHAWCCITFALAQTMRTDGCT